MKRKAARAKTTAVIQARVSSGEKVRIEAAAARDNRTVSAWLRHIVRTALQQEGARAYNARNLASSARATKVRPAPSRESKAGLRFRVVR